MSFQYLTVRVSEQSDWLFPGRELTQEHGESVCGEDQVVMSVRGACVEQTVWGVGLGRLEEATTVDD